MGNEHDAGYKMLFAHPEMVRDLLTGFVPYPWVHRIELAALERVNASYVSDHGEQRHDDMVWRIRLEQDWLYVYLLLEFQSNSEHWMALRMQVYAGLLYQDLVRQRQLSPEGKLPPVLPIVLYQGGARWSAPCALDQLLLAPPAGLAGLQPQQRYLLIDHSSYASAELARQRNLVAAVFRLLRSRRREEFNSVLSNLGDWLRDPSCASLRFSMQRWVARRLRQQLKKSSISESSDINEVRIMVEQYFETLADEWEYNGRQKGLKEGLELGVMQGREQGLKRGIEQGRVGAQREQLAKLLVRRFGELPAAVSARIAVASLEQLDRWFDQILDAPTLQHLFPANQNGSRPASGR